MPRLSNRALIARAKASRKLQSKRMRQAKKQNTSITNGSDIFFVDFKLVDQYVNNLTFDPTNLLVIPIGIVFLFLEKGSSVVTDGIQLPKIPDDNQTFRILIPSEADYGRLLIHKRLPNIQNHSFLIEIVVGPANTECQYIRYDARGISENWSDEKKAEHAHKCENLKKGYKRLRIRLNQIFRKTYSRTLGKELVVPLATEKDGCTLATVSALCCRIRDKLVISTDDVYQGTNLFRKPKDWTDDTKTMRKAILDASGWTLDNLEEYANSEDYEVKIDPRPPLLHLPKIYT